MKKLVLTMLAAGFSLSSYAQLGGLLNKATSKVAGGLATDSPIQGTISPVHKQHMGEVVFASSVDALTTQQENEAAFSKTFTLGKPIFFRAYAANSLSNNVHHLLPEVNRSVLDTQCGYRMTFVLDGVTAYTGMIVQELTEEQKQYASFKGAFSTGDGQDSYIGVDLFRLFLTNNEAKLMPGAHRLKIELAPACEYPEEKTGAAVATGEITLNVGASTVNPNDPTMCLPTANMTDPALAAKILAAFKAKGWPEKATAVRITGTKWNIIRHEVSGAIIKRTVAAVVASTKGGECQYQQFIFAQDYDGSGYQPQVYISGIGGPSSIPCGCLK